VARETPAGPAEIHIFFAGILNDKLRGFYLSQSERRKYAVTQFEATDARRAFPCFDEPAYKAVFNLTLPSGRGPSQQGPGKCLHSGEGPAAEEPHRISATVTRHKRSLFVGKPVCERSAALDEGAKVLS
jgi:aminopeptidase N/puromycin-sensitive aminopeptidase